MDLVEDGTITSPRFVLSRHLEETFCRLWNRYVGASKPFQPRVATPFWHMKQEPFYSLHRYDGGDITELTNFYSVSNLREKTYATIDEDLFRLMQKPDERAKLREILINTYLVVLHK